MSCFELFDRSRIQLRSVSTRKSALRVEQCLPLAPPPSVYQHAEFAELVETIIAARRHQRPVILFVGAHVIKLGLAADVQLRQFVRDWCRGPRGNALSGYSDRDRSFDVLLREMTRRFETPTVVETGTIRAEEDWSGAGFFTYLAGAYLQQRGGHLHSVDLNEPHCRFARTWTAVFGDTVKVTAQDSVEFLRRFEQPIDLLYLDSLDTTEPGHAEHALQEVQAALPRLHPHSVILLDDTPWQDGAWIGKGAQAVPYLLTQGWQVLYAGYQVILTRNDIR